MQNMFVNKSLVKRYIQVLAMKKYEKYHTMKIFNTIQIMDIAKGHAC